MESELVSYQAASLYVGDLHHDVSEATLYEKFSSIGPILSISVCRDANTNRSLGYAYVNFKERFHAEFALKTMNFTLINNKPIRIMWSQRDPSLRRSNVGNVFIKNLDKRIDSKTLFDTFSVFGNILSCKLALDKKGISKGYGFVHFKTKEAANTSIEKVNGMLLKTKKVYVGPFIRREVREKNLRENAKSSTNLYIKNFDEDWNENKLREMFEPFGKIISLKVMTDDDGKSKGFGFVAFETTEAAESAIRTLNNKELKEGKALYVGPAKTKDEREREFEEMKNKSQERNLYVKNLDCTIDDERLRKEFSIFGKITSAKVMTYQDGLTSKGFGFVCFDSIDEAKRAVTEMNGKKIESKQICVAFAQRKEERKVYLAAQYTQHVSDVCMQQTSQITLPNGLSGFFVPTSPQTQVQVGSTSQGIITAAPVASTAQFCPHETPAVVRGATQAVQAALTAKTVTLRNPSAREIRKGQARDVNKQMTAPIAASTQKCRHSLNMSIISFKNAQYQSTVQPYYRTGQKLLIAPLLTNASPAQQKRIIGEHLFLIVERMLEDTPYTNLTAKITGMILEKKTSELLQLLDDMNLLGIYVDGAIAALRAVNFI